VLIFTALVVSDNFYLTNMMMMMMMM